MEDATVTHVNLVCGLIFLVELSRIEELDGEEVGNHSNLRILEAVFSEQFLDLSSPVPDVCRGLTKPFPVHELGYFMGLLLVGNALKMSFL